MLEVLKTFLAEFSDGTKKLRQFDENDYRLAAAALLVHIVSADGNVTDIERSKLRALLGRRFTLDDAATGELIKAATEADREAVDLYRFTNLLNRLLDDDGRRRIIAMMWQIVYADGRRTELEDNIVWRVADLLGISSRDRIELRRKIAEESSTPDE